MSAIPAFEIGLWNAWIFVLPYLLVTYGLAFLIVNRESPLFTWPPYTKLERKLLAVLMATLVASWIYSIFLPLKTGTAWLYAGLSIYLMGMILVTIVTLGFAATPVDKPVTKGVFRISRNPMYSGWFLIYIGIGIAGASWIFLLIALALVVLMDILVVPEERFCHEKYGSTYQEYMDKTPKWIGIPKSVKSD